MAVEDGTREFRAHQAGRHRMRATRARIERDHLRAKWHSQRAQGQRERFDRVRACGSQELVVRCPECGWTGQTVTASCKHWRICRECAGKRIREFRRRFRAGEQAHLRRWGWLTRTHLPEGVWGARMLSLTLRAGKDVRRDLAALPDAFERFMRALRKHLTSDRGVTRERLEALAYVRATEIALGDEKHGHAHLHVYLFSPYIHKEFLAVLWSRALRHLGYQYPMVPLGEVLAPFADKPRQLRQLRKLLVTRRGPHGRPLDPVPKPIVDPRIADRNIGGYMFKCVIKSEQALDGGAVTNDVDLIVAAYEGLENQRAIQASRGFFVDEEGPGCRCGECGNPHLERRRRARQPEADPDPQTIETAAESPCTG
ncbi:MAG: hypothetical protein OXU20_20480 [Myxococcales bacterium]|nr:hypothetical protein [Myxococcales bacterium]